jgi:hypothetical protein
MESGSVRGTNLVAWVEKKNGRRHWLNGATRQTSIAA